MAGSGLTHTTALILQAIATGHRYGFDVIGVTGLPSGTVYPALRRLEEYGYVRSQWESEAAAHRENRPARKYYEVRKAGEAALEQALQRFRHLQALQPTVEATSEPVPDPVGS